MYLNIRSYCAIRKHCVQKDGQTLFEAPAHVESPEFLAALYRELQLDYRKFFKMDHLSKLGFLASEILLEGQIDREEAHEDIAVILFNRSASLDIDAIYQQSIQDNGNYYPSPSEFVYTLPNIVTGEIAIRNKIFGETAFFISEQLNPDDFCRRVADVLGDAAQKAVCGWVEYNKGTYEAFLFLVAKEAEQHTLFVPENISTSGLS